MKYGKRSIWKKIIGSRITLFVVLILFIFLLKTTLGMVDKANITKERLAQSEAAYDALTARSEDLSRKVGYLSTDEGKASEIRTKFRAAENGESVAVIINNDESKDLSNSTASSTSTRISWWKKMLKVFGM